MHGLHVGPAGIGPRTRRLRERCVVSENFPWYGNASQRELREEHHDGTRHLFIWPTR